MSSEVQGPFVLIQFMGVESESLVYFLPSVARKEKEYLDAIENMHDEDLPYRRKAEPGEEETREKAFHYISSCLGHYIDPATDFDESDIPNRGECISCHKKWEKYRVSSFREANEMGAGQIKAVYSINYTIV